MSTHEVSLWSALAGGLLVLAVLALVDLFAVRRSLGALRNAIFVTLGGAAVVIISGLPEALFPALQSDAMSTIRIAIGPVAAGLILYYLGQWIGGMREDPVVYRISSWGCRAMLLATLCLIAAALMISPQSDRVLGAAGGVVLLAVLLGFGLAARAAVLGDALARWMAASCVMLLFTTLGLYLHAMQPPYFGIYTSILTAVFTLAHFILAIVLVGKRNRHLRKLNRLARLDPAIEPTTGLPAGASLVSQIEHAFWVAARRKGHCLVVCIYLSNLYELADTVGHGADSQILLAVAARIRRVVGFRCVVGVYHPRCFVVVLDADRHRARVASTLLRLRAFLPQPLEVQGTDAQMHSFTPVVGVGLVEAAPQSAKALDVLHEAERQAQFGQAVQSEDFIETQPGSSA